MPAALARRLGGAVLAVVLSSVSWFPAVAAGPSLPVPVIMVVDPQAAMLQSKAGKLVRAEHERYRQSLQNELEAGRKALTETESELMKQKSVLTQDAWQQKARSFDKRVMEFNQHFQKVNLAVEKSYRAAMADLGRAFAEVTAEVANEVGSNLVLPMQQVVLHDPHMDLTAAVIERMNTKYPSVSFPPPAVEGEVPSPAAGQAGKK